MKLWFIMNSDTLICVWIFVFTNGIFEVSTPRKWGLWLYFSTIHDYWTPSTWNYLVHTLWGEMERCEKRVLNSSKCEKELQLNHKNQLRNLCFSEICLRVWKFTLVIRWWAHKIQKVTLISFNIMRN